MRVSGLKSRRILRPSPSIDCFALSGSRFSRALSRVGLSQRERHHFFFAYFSGSFLNFSISVFEQK